MTWDLETHQLVSRVAQHGALHYPPQVREDLVQDGVIAGWLAHERWDPELGSLCTFMYPRVRGGQADSARKQHGYSRTSGRTIIETEIPEELPLTDSAPGPEELVLEQASEYETRAIVARALETELTRAQCYVITEIFMHGRNGNDVCKDPGFMVTESRVCQIKQAALRRLAEVPELQALVSAA